MKRDLPRRHPCRLEDLGDGGGAARRERIVVGIAGPNVGMADHEVVQRQALIDNLGKLPQRRSFGQPERVLVRVEVDGVQKLQLGHPGPVRLRGRRCRWHRIAADKRQKAARESSLNASRSVGPRHSLPLNRSQSRPVRQGASRHRSSVPSRRAQECSRRACPRESAPTGWSDESRRSAKRGRAHCAASPGRV